MLTNGKRSLVLDKKLAFTSTHAIHTHGRMTEYAPPRSMYASNRFMPHGAPSRVTALRA
jgi:hypothetical protein